MFLNSWSLGLTLAALIVLLLGIFACRTAVRVLRHWDPSSDSNLQIKLENEIWLASTLVEYGLGFQILTLVLFVLAADTFCQVIVGAMCATGALLANSFGMPALLVKIAGVFLYGFWIVLHKLDISSETYPLVKIKYIYLLLILPLLIADITLQTLYIANLSPDIITSCCAVVFGSGAETGRNLLEGFSQANLAVSLLRHHYCSAGVGLSAAATLGPAPCRSLFGWLALVFGPGDSCNNYPFFLLHLCHALSSLPFLHTETGVSLYRLRSLLHTDPGLFLRLFNSACRAFKGRNDLAGPVRRYQRAAIRVSLLLMLLLAAISSYHFLLYTISGGE